MPIIALLTDFSTRDSFVAVMKAVMLRICPNVTIIDITHEIPPGAIERGAFILRTSFSEFPENTVFCVVVDPGVGSARKVLAIRSAHYVFVGPDNGILSFVPIQDSPVIIHECTNETFFRKPISATFHGRDKFAPVAAHIASGTPLGEVGPICEQIQPLCTNEPFIDGDTLHGVVTYFDRFGNAVTTIPAHLIAGKEKQLQCRLRGRVLPFVTHYSAVSAGKPCCLIDSFGFLEIAVNSGCAEKQLDITLGERVTVTNARDSVNRDVR